MINKSKSLEELNDPEGAVAALREAAPLVEDSSDTRLCLCVHFNQMAPIFQAQGVQRETLAALRVFCEAAEREAATLEMARKLLELLERCPAIS